MGRNTPPLSQDCESTLTTQRGDRWEGIHIVALPGVRGGQHAAASPPPRRPSSTSFECGKVRVHLFPGCRPQRPPCTALAGQPCQWAMRTPPEIFPPSSMLSPLLVDGCQHSLVSAAKGGPSFPPFLTSLASASLNLLLRVLFLSLQSIQGVLRSGSDGYFRRWPDAPQGRPFVAFSYGGGALETPRSPGAADVEGALLPLGRRAFPFCGLLRIQPSVSGGGTHKRLVWSWRGRVLGGIEGRGGGE